MASIAVPLDLDFELRTCLQRLVLAIDLLAKESDTGIAALQTSAEEQIQLLETTLASASELIELVQEQLTELQESSDTLEQVYEGRIDSLEQQVESLNTAVSVIQSTTIPDLQSQIDSLDTRVTALENP